MTKRHWDAARRKSGRFPICYSTAGWRQTCVLLDQNRSRLRSPGCSEGVKFNAGGQGYYWRRLRFGELKQADRQRGQDVPSEKISLSTTWALTAPIAIVLGFPGTHRSMRTAASGPSGAHRRCLDTFMTIFDRGRPSRALRLGAAVCCARADRVRMETCSRRHAERRTARARLIRP